MTALDEFAQLGRIHLWLRIVGFLLWAFLGLSRLWQLDWEHVSSLPWIPLWLLYGAAYVVHAQYRKLPLWSARGLLAVQAVSVFLMPRLGYQSFEGMMLAIVVIEATLVFSLRTAALWWAGQLLPLLWSVYPLQAPVHLIEILGAYSAFSLFVLLTYWAQLRERSARAQLVAANAELLSTRALLVENSRQGERLRISRELHDSLGHHLTALTIQLQLANRLPPEAAGEAVNRAQGISREALADVRRVVTQMQAPLQIGAALTALASRIVKPAIHLELNEELVLEDPECAHALFRCVQEAITNSVKHADAKNLWVMIRAGDESVEVRVRDDGKGTGKMAEGNGLNGIRGRIEQLGGSAKFQSQAGRGFELHLVAPLKRAAR